jgi:hypothetical protein
LGRCAVFAADGFDLPRPPTFAIKKGWTNTARYPLDSLVRKSLVTVTHVGGHARCGMLETIRQFAEDQLAATGTISEVRDRHADYFAKQAVWYWDMWDGSRQRVAADWVDAELANLRVGFRWAADQGDVATAAAIAAHTALLNWTLQRFEPAAWAEEILDAATTADWRQLPACTPPSLCMFTGRPDAALGYAQTAVALEGDPRYESFETGVSGLEATANASPVVDRCLELCTAVAREPGFAHVIGLCGLLYTLSAGADRRARAIAEDTVSAARRQPLPHRLGARWVRPCLQQDRSRRALTTLRHGLSTPSAFPFGGLISPEAAELEAAHGELEQALGMFDTTIDAQHRAGNVANVATTLACLAVLFDRIDKPDIAATVYGACTHHASISLAINVPDVLTHLRSVLGETVFDERVSMGAAMDPPTRATPAVDPTRPSRPVDPVTRPVRSVSRTRPGVVLSTAPSIKPSPLPVPSRQRQASTARRAVTVRLVEGGRRDQSRDRWPSLLRRHDARRAGTRRRPDPRRR